MHQALAVVYSPVSEDAEASDRGCLLMKPWPEAEYRRTCGNAAGVVGFFLAMAISLTIMADVGLHQIGRAASHELNQYRQPERQTAPAHSPPANRRQALPTVAMLNR